MQEENNLNPFKAPTNLWHVEFQTKYKNLQFLDLIFEDAALATSSYEIASATVESHEEDIWMYICYYGTEIDEEYINSIAGSYIDGNINIYEEKEEDWISAVQKDAKPKYTGRFYVANHEQITSCPSDYIPIEIDAGRAFGTGEHETTAACLELLSTITLPQSNILDVGTGSGILAIASQKLWPAAHIVACDIDEVALEVASNNALINNTNFDLRINYIEFLNSQKFDLIISNILANPLVEMSHDFKNMLNSKGKLILSGFIQPQLEQVLDAYKQLGFQVEKIIEKNQWNAVMLQN